MSETTREIAARTGARPASDPVNHPAHYNSHPSGVECIEVVEHFNFNIGNAVKYLWRAGLKGAVIEDLLKASWYALREARRLGWKGQEVVQATVEVDLRTDAAGRSVNRGPRAAVDLFYRLGSSDAGVVVLEVVDMREVPVPRIEGSSWRRGAMCIDDVVYARTAGIARTAARCDAAYSDSQCARFAQLADLIDKYRESLAHAGGYTLLPPITSKASSA